MSPQDDELAMVWNMERHPAYEYATDEPTARAAFVRKYNQEPEEVGVVVGGWWAAGPVREADNG